MKLVPLGEMVVVRRSEPEPTTAGGIVLPETAQRDTREGRVLSVGDGRLLADGRRVAHQVSEGDRVVFDRYAGAEITIDGQELLILRESDILAIVG